MRVAAIYDIHANLPALEAVLQDIRGAEVDQVDVVPGPMPRETIEYLLGLDIPVQFIQGNGEVDVLAEMAGMEVSRVPKQFREVVRWSARQLRPEHEQLLANWPSTCRLEIRGLGEVLFCHATSRSDTEIFTRLTLEDRLLPVFEGLNVPVVICGHTHMQFDRTIGNVRVANAGSVGMPFGESGAHWLLLGPKIQFQHTTYDLAKAAERIRDTNYPRAQDFAARNILQPPSEREMLEAFSKVELR
jgi:diadenosine tetraphosphatase ApaH/serine/threonine PP2A family protein phosphatase